MRHGWFIIAFNDAIAGSIHILSDITSDILYEKLSACVKIGPLQKIIACDGGEMAKLSEMDQNSQIKRMFGLRRNSISSKSKHSEYALACEPGIGFQFY